MEKRKHFQELFKVSNNSSEYLATFKLIYVTKCMAMRCIDVEAWLLCSQIVMNVLGNLF